MTLLPIPATVTVTEFLCITADAADTYTRLNKSPDPSRQPNRPSAVLVFARSGGGGVICAGDVIAVAGAHLAHDPRVEGRQNERRASQISREKGSGHRRQAATFAERARWTEGGRI